MKKTFAWILAAVLFLLAACGACAAGFLDDQDRIESAAKSVLKLYVYQYENQDVSRYSGTGSGFVAFDSGKLITNYHVIDGVVRVLALDDDDNAYELDKVLCADQAADIAILSFASPTNMKPLDLYPDDTLKRGAPVVAIGSPKGLKNTVSTGIVSSVFTEDGIPTIQITAPISPGSSGGALFNNDGRVIGVTSSGYISEDEYGRNTNAQNLNFAVNIAVAQAMYNAWDGKTYTLKNHKSSARMDFSGVYRHESATVSSPDAIEKAAESNEPWTCLNCGKENTTRYCRECGAERPYWICACGAANTSNKFCGACGTGLSGLIDEMNRAISLAAQHNYDGAVKIVSGLGHFNSGSFATADGDHAEAESYVGKMYYDQGMYLLESGGRHEAIVEAFTKAGDYADAKQQAEQENQRYLKSWYDKGTKQLKAKKYTEARQAFARAGDYRDAKTQILKSYYTEAEEQYRQKEYTKAMNLFRQAGDYSDAKDRISEINVILGDEALAKGETAKAKAYYAAAGDYGDAKAKLEQINNDDKQVKYNAAADAFSKGDYQSAFEQFTALSGFRDADKRAEKSKLKYIQQRIGKINTDPGTMSDAGRKELEELLKAANQYKKSTEAASLAKRINYILGGYWQSRNNDRAIGYYTQAGNYQNAAEQLQACRIKKMDSFVAAGEIPDALNYYNTEINPDGSGPEYALVKPGSKGSYVKTVLGLLKPLGIQTEGDIDTGSYTQAYTPYVKKLEQHFGMTADGTITVSEYQQLRGAIYPGLKSDSVTKLLEKLADLSYVTGLAQTHSTYNSKLSASIKNAEKKLGLQADGIVTQSEYKSIMNRKVTAPAKPTGLKAKVKNNTVTLSWTAVKGARRYEIKRDGKVVGTTAKTSWTHRNVTTGVKATYTVAAKKYTVTGQAASKTVNIPRYYPSVSVAKLNSYKGRDVKLENLKLYGWSVQTPGGTYSKETSTLKKAKKQSGYTLILICSKGSKYVEIRMENYSGWSLDKKGKNIADYFSKIKTLTVKGTVQSTSSSWKSLGSMPSVIAGNLTWKYK